MLMIKAVRLFLDQAENLSYLPENAEFMATQLVAGHSGLLSVKLPRHPAWTNCLAVHVGQEREGVLSD